jgi:hypothetical protein
VAPAIDSLPLMITFGLIMCNILSECSTKRCLTKENHAIQAFVFYRTHKPFCKNVTVGRSHRVSNRLHALSFQIVSELLGCQPAGCHHLDRKEIRGGHNAQCAFKNVLHELRFSRTGAGSMPCLFRIFLTVFGATM